MIPKFAAVMDKKAEPYYILAGNNNFLNDEFIGELSAKLFGTGDASSGTDTYHADDKDAKIPVESIIENAKTRPFFSEKKLIIIKSFDRYKADEMEILMGFLGNIPEFSCLVLISGMESRDFSKKMDKYNVPDKNMVDFSNLRDSDIMDWVKTYISKDSKKIEYEVMDYIIYESNGDMGMIKNEIDKLVLFTGNKPEITIEDFNKTRGVEKGFSIFDFSDAIGEANEKKALAIFEKIYEDTPPEYILGFVFSSIYRIYIAKYYIGNSGFMSKQAEQEAGRLMNWFTLKKAKEHAKNYMKIPFIDMLRILKDADKKIKLSSKENGKIIFQVMLEKIFMRLNPAKQ